MVGTVVRLVEVGGRDHLAWSEPRSHHLLAGIWPELQIAKDQGFESLSVA